MAKNMPTEASPPVVMSAAPQPQLFSVCLASIGGTPVEVIAKTEAEAVEEFKRIAPLCGQDVQVTVTAIE